MFALGGSFIFSGFPEDLDCPCCKAKLGDNHSPGCNRLAAMRAQAYPEIINDAGVERKIAKISELNKKIASMESAWESERELLKQQVHVLSDTAERYRQQLEELRDRLGVR